MNSSQRERNEVWEVLTMGRYAFLGTHCWLHACIGFMLGSDLINVSSRRRNNNAVSSDPFLMDE